MEDHLAMSYAFFPTFLMDSADCLMQHLVWQVSLRALGRSVRNSIHPVIPLSIVSPFINFISYSYIQKYSFLYN